ncbi:hypothetical protein N9P57_00670 [Planktomarina temperata]|nr:hypothetical protein [Planktomarina temperata]
MSESDFISMHVNGGVPVGGKLHININNLPSAIGGIAQVRATSIVIGETAFSIDGVTTGQSLNLDNVFEQIERIQFNFPTDESTLNFDVTVENIALYTSPTHDPFYYFQIIPKIIPDTVKLLEYQDIVVTIDPFLLTVQYINNAYNPLIGNGLTNRKSQERVESDRTEDSATPTNWDAIISGSAPFATVQDSMYYDTGWTRGRYEGTKIKSTGNTGIQPAISGIPFTGEIFTYDAEDEFICSTTREKVSIEEMLHTSDKPLPVFTSSSLKDSNSTDISVTIFTPTSITLSAAVAPPQKIDIGDILSMNYTYNSDDYNELMRVLELPDASTFNTPRYVVERGYAETVKYTSGTFEPLAKVSKFDIFKLEQQTSEYVRLINDAKILVQGNNTIIDTDKYGNVVREHVCTQ